MRRLLLALALFAGGCAASRPPAPDVVHFVRGGRFKTCDLELVTAADRPMSEWECTPIERLAR